MAASLASGAADVASRAQIDELLLAFYRRAMTDALLGPVFVDVAHLDLVAHLPRIGDFWERTLLGSGDYAGQPMAVHRRLHEAVALTPEMFDRWLELWESEIDDAHQGPVAQQAKDTARRVAVATLRQLADGPSLLQIIKPAQPAQERE